MMDVLLKYLSASFMEHIYPEIRIDSNIYKNFPNFDEHFERALMKWKHFTDKEKIKSLAMNQFK